MDSVLIKMKVNVTRKPKISWEVISIGFPKLDHLLLTWVQTVNIKLKWQNYYQWDNFSDFLKTNTEEELVSGIGKEFQMVGLR